MLTGIPIEHRISNRTFGLQVFGFLSWQVRIGRLIEEFGPKITYLRSANLRRDFLFHEEGDFAIGEVCIRIVREIDAFQLEPRFLIKVHCRGIGVLSFTYERA